jgi:hypothetical protein
MLDVAPGTHPVNRRFTPAPVSFTTSSARESGADFRQSLIGSARSTTKRPRVSD